MALSAAQISPGNFLNYLTPTRFDYSMVTRHLLEEQVAVSSLRLFPWSSRRRCYSDLASTTFSGSDSGEAVSPSLQGLLVEGRLGVLLFRMRQR